ncbi:hypothetical protein [Flectobacillus longus]|uniref:hypothetical protein n=1 Tax=Flectobacillus longus TaxID=2984207 RepID=UPI0024B803E1|nr:hypothetical protein [Flectobacillus longus]MDI9881252.1 hypothetical protein [Flectobacillus longus]
MKRNYAILIAIGLILLCLGSTSLLLLDLVKGDGNMIVAGIPMALVSKWSFWAALLWALWAGVKFKVEGLLNLFLAIFMTILVVVGLEIGSGWVLKAQASKGLKVEGPEHSMEMDTTLGYKPKPNGTYSGIKKVNGKTIYHITYQTDSNSLRITPVDSIKKTPDFAQFYGCSMTFGEGVQSTETIPFYFGQYTTNFHPYNFAYSGYGPHQALARLETPAPSKIVKEKQGVGFYIYIDDHVNRVIGTMTNFGYNRGNAPYFHNESGKLEHTGLFITGRKLRSLVYDTMLGSNLLKLFKVGYPFKITKDDYALTADVIAGASKSFQTQFPHQPFYAVIYPTTIDSQLIIGLLKDRNVKVIDLSKLFNPLDPKYAIPYDEHPTALGNQVFTKALVQKFKEAQNSN